MIASYEVTDMQLDDLASTYLNKSRQKVVKDELDKINVAKGFEIDHTCTISCSMLVHAGRFLRTTCSKNTMDGSSEN